MEIIKKAVPNNMLVKRKIFFEDNYEFIEIVVKRKR